MLISQLVVIDGKNDTYNNARWWLYHSLIHLHLICSSDRYIHFYYRLKQRAQHFFILCCALSETKGKNYKYD